MDIDVLPMDAIPARACSLRLQRPLGDGGRNIFHGGPRGVPQSIEDREGSLLKLSIRFRPRLDSHMTTSYSTPYFAPYQGPYALISQRNIEVLPSNFRSNTIPKLSMLLGACKQ